MQHLIDFFKIRLEKELPHHDIRKEGLSDRLLELLLEAEQVYARKHSVNPPRICAVMIAFYQYKDDFFLPMMVRPSRSKVHPGQIAFPGGMQEAIDLDIIDTAIREMEEEVGVSVRRGSVLGKLSPVYIPPSNSLVTPIVSYLENPPSYTPDPREVAEVIDVKISDLQNPLNKKNKPVTLPNGEPLEMPAYHIDNRVIWGGTARMISELNKLLEEMVIS